ncbi:MAG TPA: hypothetical protein VMW42_00480 [Desulfatiglandales bacterium]|nr:hypothetical protein [Desulfatiglandales bacterium]
MPPKTKQTPLEKHAQKSETQEFRDQSGKLLWNKEFLHFISSGMDYKGQFNAAFQSFGKAVKVEIGVDFGEIFFPSVSPLLLETRVSMKLKKAAHTLIAAEVQDIPLKKGSDGKIIMKPNPDRLCLMCMQGYYTSFAAALEVEAGVKVGLPSTVPTNMAAETLGFNLGAKASATVGVKYEGTYIHVSDLSPNFYLLSDKKALQEDLKFAYKTSLKAELKKEAVEYINGLGVSGVQVKYSRKLGFGHIPSEDLVNTFMAILNNSSVNLSSEQKKLCFSYIHALLHYSAEYKFNHYCSLKYWGHQGGAGAGVSASAEAGAFAPGLGMGAKVTVKGPSVEGSIKYASYRLQTITKYNKVKTQDTLVTYKQISGDVVGIEAEGTIKVPNKELTGQVGKTKRWSVLNSIAYTSAICYWSPGEVDSSDKTVRSRTGSGICFAHSITPGALISYYKAVGQNLLYNRAKTAIQFKQLTKTEKSAWAFVNGLAKALRTTPEQVEFFLNQEEAKDLLGGKDLFDEEFAPGAVILEATFNVTKNMMIKTEEKNTSDKMGHKMQGVAIDKNLIKTFTKVKGELQSIRLRYRICDFADYGQVKFALGFKLVVSVGIELSRVSEAGTDGLVDLFTCWFKSGKTGVQSDPKAIYEERATVPPTALLYQ